MGIEVLKPTVISVWSCTALVLSFCVALNPRVTNRPDFRGLSSEGSSQLHQVTHVVHKNVGPDISAYEVEKVSFLEAPMRKEQKISYADFKKWKMKTKRPKRVVRLAGQC